MAAHRDRQPEPVAERGIEDLVVRKPTRPRRSRRDGRSRRASLRRATATDAFGASGPIGVERLARARLVEHLRQEGERILDFAASAACARANTSPLSPTAIAAGADRDRAAPENRGGIAIDAAGARRRADDAEIGRGLPAQHRRCSRTAPVTEEDFHSRSTALRMSRSAAREAPLQLAAGSPRPVSCATPPGRTQPRPSRLPHNSAVRFSTSPRSRPQ